MKKNVVDKCRICLETGALSFDHVPPKSAFNKGPVWLHDPEKMLHLTSEERSLIRGRKDQKGTGRHSLCRSCNSMLGSQYVRAYSELTAYVAHLLFDRAPTANERLGPFLFRTRPLNLVKCICGMALSVSLPESDTWLDSMRAFVVNKDVCQLPAGIRVFIYASRSMTTRQLSQFAALTTHSGPVGFTELYSVPLGVVLTFDSGPLDTRHMEITHFAFHSYNQEVEISYTLPILNVDGPLPLY